MKQLKKIGFLLAMIFAFALQSEAQNYQKKSRPAPTVNNNGEIEVIQFHNEHRCKTCLSIENYTKETVAKYGNIPFKLINVDDKKNGDIVMQFKAFGSSLFLYNPSTKKMKDLTDFAFMNAFDKEKFETGLDKAINEFKK